MGDPKHNVVKVQPMTPIHEHLDARDHANTNNEELPETD